jgi:oligopeptide transport system permease protein
VSLAVGLVATLVSLVIGVSWGATAGYLGGRIDNAMMRFVDMLYSIPFIFVVIFLVTILSEPTTIKPWLDRYGIDRIVIFFIVVGAIYWLTMSRVVRGQVISLKQNQFIEAARTIGASQPRIIFRHLVPNLLSIVIVYLTLTIPSVMLFEAFLSFLGLGVEAPDVSWGLLANEGVNVITPIKIYWWLVVFPGLALGLTLFSLNVLGDGLRDALDPRLKNR